MPSPIAHCSIALLTWPRLRGEAAPLSWWRKTLLVGAMLFSLIAPDLDIALGIAFGDGPFVDHGGAMHSFGAALVWGVLFAFACRLIAGGGSMVRFYLVGTFAYASHVMLDACTFGRGVAMFWPLHMERVRLPIPLFSGVRHSSPEAYVDHLYTISTELLFALLLWRVLRMFRTHSRTAADSSLQGCELTTPVSACESGGRP